MAEPIPEDHCKHCIKIWEDKVPICFNTKQNNEQHLSKCPGQCSIMEGGKDEQR